MGSFQASLNLLSPAQYAVLIGVPVGILALYFLKLRRAPMLVPSTMLWQRAIEDLRANSLFQRLRSNLLLILQLLAVLLVILALLGLTSEGTATNGQKYVIVLDNSASMTATDVKPSRLEKAKVEAIAIVDGMGGDDQALVISFAEDAQVVSSFTNNRSRLRARINGIKPTQATTSLAEALQVAEGLANPSGSEMEAEPIPEGVVATEYVLNKPKLVIFSDGGFPDVSDFRLGRLEPELVVIGRGSDELVDPEQAGEVVDDAKAESGPEPQRSSQPSNNIGLIALQTRRDETRPDRYEVFGRVINHRAEPANIPIRLYRLDVEELDGLGQLVDSREDFVVAGGQARSFAFQRTETGQSELFRLELDIDDDLGVDNIGYTTILPPRQAQILIVTEGNSFLTETLSTSATLDRARVATIDPEAYSGDGLQREVQLGRYDLIIFDNVQPEQDPEANTLYLGKLPPGESYVEKGVMSQPVVLDWDITHPLIEYIRDLPTVTILKAIQVELPAGADVLIESEQGPLAFAIPRRGFIDAVITFAILDDEQNLNTNWPFRQSFPLFMFNVLNTLGNTGESISEEIKRPGESVELRAEGLAEEIVIVGPEGQSETLSRNPRGSFVFTKADLSGLYTATWSRDAEAPDLAFAVNLLDERESDIAPRGLKLDGQGEPVKIGYSELSGRREVSTTNQDWWKLLAIAALGIVAFEWYIYNKRIYL